jgi:hypothetical protein
MRVERGYRIWSIQNPNMDFGINGVEPSDPTPEQLVLVSQSDEPFSV